MRTRKLNKMLLIKCMALLVVVFGLVNNEMY